jgi:predicted outer membrane protein
MHTASLRRVRWTLLFFFPLFSVLLFAGPVSVGRAEIPVPGPSTGVDDDSSDDTGEDRDSPTAALLGRLHLANIQASMMGKRAEKKGQSQEARDLGTELVRDHGAADKRLLAFAKRRKLDVSVTGQTVAETSPGSSRTFDEKFAEAVLESHQKSIADIERARQTSTDDELDAFLASVLTMLQHHRDMAQQQVDTHTTTR